MDGRSYFVSNNSSNRRVITPPATDDNKQFVMPNMDDSTNDTPQIGFPYNQQHLPTSNPTPYIIDNPTISFSASEATPATPTQISSTAHLQNYINQVSDQAAGKLVRQKKAADQARQQYHTAWQNYYQKYYENYYIAALQEQQKRFAEQRAEVVDSREEDGKLSQSEVQERLQSDILNKVKSTHAKAKSKWWWVPLIVAIITILAFLFLQYNSVIAAKVASYISPGSSSSQTIIVGTGINQPVSDSPRIIIPKINVDAPVTYGLTSLDENTVQTALQNGPVNYPVTGATAIPGQKGNTVILGHSSADVFAPGDYKFIFVQLNRLAEGDLFYLDYGKTRYTYKVAQLKVINPDQISELNLGTDKPYATLITCDPPGTTARRLLVIAEQVSPDPNAASTVQTNEVAATSITGKPKTLLENIFGN
ncbi:MAG: sortase [Candidatus Saccharibacteria bacterium]|nr:sortase [Candidatus Saccharibacteria bacterium]